MAMDASVKNSNRILPSEGNSVEDALKVRSWTGAGQVLPLGGSGVSRTVRWAGSLVSDAVSLRGDGKSRHLLSFLRWVQVCLPSVVGYGVSLEEEWRRGRIYSDLTLSYSYAVL